MAATTTAKKKTSFVNEIKATVEPEHEAKKGGRPAGGAVKKLSLAIPVELMNGIEAAASLLHNGNKTAYINALIKKDLDDNLEKYQEFQAMRNR